MIAGEHAEAAGIHRDRFVDAKLGREVGDLGRGVRVFVPEPGGGLHVRGEGIVHAVEVGKEFVVGRQFVEALLTGRVEQSDRTVVEGLEPRGINVPEQGDGVGVPAPPKVVSEVVQGLEPFGKPG